MNDRVLDKSLSVEGKKFPLLKENCLGNPHVECLGAIEFIIPSKYPIKNVAIGPKNG